MDQTAKNALKLLREIKSVAFAAVNNGEPAVRIIDGMLVEEDGLYFLTARGKASYKQLKADQKQHDLIDNGLTDNHHRKENEHGKRNDCCTPA